MQYIFTSNGDRLCKKWYVKFNQKYRTSNLINWINQSKQTGQEMFTSPGDTHFWRKPEPLFSTRQRHRSKQSIVFHNIPDIAKTKERLT